MWEMDQFPGIICLKCNKFFRNGLLPFYKFRWFFIAGWSAIESDSDIEGATLHRIDCGIEWLVGTQREVLVVAYMAESQCEVYGSILSIVKVFRSIGMPNR